MPEIRLRIIAAQIPEDPILSDQTDTIFHLSELLGCKKEVNYYLIEPETPLLAYL